MTLTILELLYIVLIMFSSIIWTLLVLVLLRVLKILWPIMEVVNIIEKVKKLFKAYASIPDMLKDKVKETIKNKKDSSKRLSKKS